MSPAPLRVGIAGCGNVALNDHVPAYLALPELFRVVALADPTPSRRRVVAERLRLGPEVEHESVGAMVDSADLEIVDICTPPDQHRGSAEVAAAAGRHIVCEKPLATTPLDADRIVQAAHDSGVTLAMVHNYLHFPEFMTLRRMVAEGAVGSSPVVLLDSLGIADNPGAPGYRPRWRHEPAAGGGVLMDLIHLVYLAEALLGSPIVRVSAIVDVMNPADQVEALALCRFETSAGIAVVNVGWGDGPGGIRVSGSKGRLEVRYRDGATGPYVPIEHAAFAPSGGEPRALDLSGPRDTHRLALAALGGAIRNGIAPEADGHAGARAVAATVAAYASAALGRTVELPLGPDDPVYRLGAIGLGEVELPPSSPVRRHGLFGVPMG